MRSQPSRAIPPTTWVAAATIVVGLGCSGGQGTQERQVVDSAAAALGGRQRIEAVRTLLLEGEGKQFNLGQDVRPGATGQAFTLSNVSRRVDVAAQRSRTELTRTPNFAYFQGQAPQRQIQGLDGDVAYTINVTGGATRLGGTQADDRRADFYHHPITLLRAAFAEDARLSNARTDGPHRLVDIRTPRGQTLTLTIDTYGVPTRIESRSYHANLGDVRLSTQFDEYQETGGVKLPARAATRVDDFLTTDLTFTRQRVDADIGDLAAPAMAASAAPPTPPAPNVTAEAVAPGLWLLAGQSHHSVLVEYADHLLLIEAPQSEARTRAAMAKARELTPRKPLTKVVTTHHHFDHTAGIRAAIAEGLGIITHTGNRAFFEEIARRPHTIVPDLLQKGPKPVSIETVDDERIVKDSSMTMTLYHVRGNPHSETMLMAYFPASRVLVEVDAYSPGSPINPYAANLLENISTRGLVVERIVPLHGAIAAFTDLKETVRKGER